MLKVKKCIFIIILIILISFIFYSLIRNFNIISDSNLYYYLFSTIVQGFLALGGVLGTAVVFKIQLIDNNLESIRDHALPTVRYYKGLPSESYSWEEVRDVLVDALSHEENLTAKSFLLKINSLESEKKNIIKKAVWFFIIMFINVIVALLSIPISKLLFEMEMHLFAVLLMLVNIIISLFLIFSSLVLIFKIFNFDYKQLI
jgi:hypothetical protein